MITTSRITGRSYDTDRVIYITYIAQIAYYFQMGCDSEVLDILWDNTRNQKRPLCVVFRKSTRMRELYEMWQQHINKEEVIDDAEKV